ncbi:hypothetical protein STAS_31725 [Striga asiatica]|uniref:DNAse I-like superfamily protein n=1 Tax=Striga asiatica TaxID=4170 RepID=A0A5A7RA29_STRAF|nr:hypothetical protein STAS_31725 [Striga asiatica]
MQARAVRSTLFEGPPLGFERRCFYREPDGTRGGLLLCWERNTEIIQMQATEFSNQVQYRLESSNKVEWIIFVYMSTSRQERELQWLYLQQEREQWGKWVIMGDRNDISNGAGKLRGDRSFEGFNNFISYMGMSLIQIKGYKFTWGNNREEEGYVEEVLDKAFGSLNWVGAHPQAKVTNIFRSSSDHRMLLLQSETNGQQMTDRFVFDKRWIQRNDITEVIGNAWIEEAYGTPFFILKEKVKKSRLALSRWNMSYRNQSKWLIEKLTLSLEEMRKLGGGRNWEE